MSGSKWQPSASIASLRLAAELRTTIRDYMQSQNVLEVCTPALSHAATTDPAIHSFQVSNRFLHTSPEFAMKRLLVAYETDIYQLCQVFRDEEQGRFHNAEFSLLEWYRIGSDHVSLMRDVERLMLACADLGGVAWQQARCLNYTDEVARVCELPFTDITVEHIESVFNVRKKSYPAAIGNDLDAACDLLLDEFVIASFQPSQTTFIVDYPASQAALSRTRTNEQGVNVASRFELYWGTVELANGFHELADATEQRARFEQDLQTRRERGLADVPMDENLLSALEQGLPDCAGVALGIDRLLMVLSGADHIGDVQSFVAERA